MRARVIGAFGKILTCWPGQLADLDQYRGLLGKAPQLGRHDLSPSWMVDLCRPMRVRVCCVRIYKLRFFPR